VGAAASVVAAGPQAERIMLATTSRPRIAIKRVRNMFFLLQKKVVVFYFQRTCADLNVFFRRTTSFQKMGYAASATTAIDSNV
jgi:hypothetical protein